jgi:2-polyprenyl-3-methyl-5-hydroxy-6-metoxy-1,4-benzoquinol methylase
MNLVPPGATVLDVGCGAGLFILMLARLRRIDSAVGFDADAAAIRVAKDAAATFPEGRRLQFVHHNAHDPWPDGRFDVVSLIDVVHHVEPKKHQELIAIAAKRLSDGGILLYKDMGSRPLWRAWANRIHDLLSVGQWISLAELDEVVAWAKEQDLQVDIKGSMDMLWYRHEWCVFRRLGATPARAAIPTG